MKVIYTAGPYSSKDPNEVDQNILNARKVATEMVKKGWGFFCPHLNSAQFERTLPDVPYTFWIALCLRMLSQCDAIVMMEGWEKSKGARTEHDFALEKGILVYYGIDQVPEISDFLTLDM